MAVIDDRRRRRGDFSPAALDGLLLAMTADPRYVFQDSAGTTAAVSHGDPVGLTTHRFGGSLDPSQSTDAARPTLDIVNGVRGLRFNGTSQFLDATGLTAASGPKTVIAGCITEDGETRGLQFLLDAQFGRIIYAAVRNVAGSVGLNDGSWSTGGAYDSESLATLTFKHYASGGGIRINGATSEAENFTESVYGGSVAVGSRFDGALSFLNGVIHVLLIFDRALSDKEIQLCEAWVAARQGRTL